MQQGLLSVFGRLLRNRLRLLHKLLSLFHALALGSVRCGFFCGSQRLPRSIRQIPLSGLKARLPRAGAPFLSRPVYKALLL